MLSVFDLTLMITILNPCLTFLFEKFYFTSLQSKHYKLLTYRITTELNFFEYFCYPLAKTCDHYTFNSITYRYYYI